MEGCRTLVINVEWAGPPVEIFNPGGDRSRLQVWGVISRCVQRAEAHFVDGPGGYELTISEHEIASGREGPPVNLAFELDLRIDVDASTVRVTSSEPQPTPAPTVLSPTQTPAPTPSPTMPGCEHYDATNVDLPAPMFIDATGLVSSCDSFDAFSSPVEPVVMLENIDNPADRKLQIAWIGTPCDGEATVTLARSGERFSITIDRDQGSNCDSRVVRRIRLNLTEPVDASLIDLTGRAH